MSAASAIPPIDETEKHAAWALYMGGFEVSEIIERMPDLNLNTLKSWISQDGWFKEREAVNVARRLKNPPEQSAVAKMFSPDKKADNIKVFQEKMGDVARKGAEYIADQMPIKDVIDKAEKVKAFSDTARKNLDLDTETIGERGHISLTFLNTPGAVTIVGPAQPKQLQESES